MSPIRSLITTTLLMAILPTVDAGVITQGTREPYRPLIQRQGSDPALNMIVLGRDHKLWYEAYNDASDLDGDGAYDVGYKGYRLKEGESTEGKGKFKIDYYGYFDSYKCYSYDSANKRFNPSSITNTKKCNGSTWSGDWLNYVTTVRIDAIRKVLYGGWRSTDTSTLTVLQRAYFPQDAHSWGKEYKSDLATEDGYKINEYTPLSAPSSGKRHLFAVTTKNNSNGGLGADLGDITKSNPFNPPLLRLVKDTDTRIWEWVSIERPVADSNHVTSTSSTKVAFNPAPTDYEVRVKVCDSTIGLEDNCKKYGTNSYKPTGLIQQYGDNDKMRFGLLTGSYGQNLQGGILRKNIGPITNEIDSATGIINNTGIIGNLNKIRIEGFNGSTEYSCGWSYTSSPMDDGASGCSMWGNPVSEMLYEAIRYFAGKTANSTYTGTNSGNSSVSNKLTLSPAPWTDPYGLDGDGNRQNSVCSRPYITLISDSNPSWDDKLPGSAFYTIADENFPYLAKNSSGAFTVPSTNTFNVSTIADNIWAQEFGKSINTVIAESGTNKDQAPTVKSVSTFSNIRGIPEEPTKRGTYYSAAAAYFAKINDINSAPEEQKITTMAVALASPLPKIEIPISGTCPGSDCKMITLTPYAKSVGGSGIDKTKGKYQPTNQIVDFYIDSIANAPGFEVNKSINGGEPYYKFRINFEDVEYGGDHDMDAIATYIIKKTASDKIEVTVTSDYAYGGIDQHMGYVISGTTDDGIYLVVKDRPDGGASNVAYWQDVQCLHPVATPCTTVLDSGNKYKDVRTFTANTSTTVATVLQPPLYYVGKYGAFTPSEGDVKDTNYNKPDKTGEWVDQTDTTGTKPSGYFLVTNPANLEKQLGQVFATIDSKSRSTAPVGAGGSSTPTNLRIYRSYFNMSQWSGGVTASNIPLDLSSPVEMWDTSKYLVSPSKRIIFTHNGTNALPFEDSILLATSPLSSRLNDTQLTEMGKNLSTPYSSSDRLQYLRGINTQEGNLFRSRELVSSKTNYYGDILDSQPYAAGAPTRSSSGDGTGYEAYRTESDDDTTIIPSGNTYYNYAVSNTLTYRRSKIFVGANDGMLHIIDDSQMRDASTNMDNGIIKVVAESILDPVSANNRPGKELMAYMPSFVYTRKDLSGTTQPKISEYSKLTGYNHEFFVNGQIAMADMIYGKEGSKKWTTVLAGTTGFGGKGIYALNVTTDVFDGSASDHVIFEYTAENDHIYGKTDPSLPTQKLSDIGYITGRPLLGKTADGKWRLIVNNGYNSDSGEAVLKLININSYDGNKFTDVITLRTGEGSAKDATGAATPSNANGLSSPVAVDGILATDGSISDADGTIDLVYAGDLKGNLWRFDISSTTPSSWSTSKLFQAKGKCSSVAATEDCIQPITVRPAVGTFQVDGKTIKLVTFGTGKVIEDCDKTAAGCSGEAYINAFYAVRDYDDSTKNSAFNEIEKKSKLQKQTIKTYKTGAENQQLFRYIEGNTSSSDCKKITDSANTEIGKQCPSFTVEYNDDPKATGAELGWYHELPEVSDIAADKISDKVVGDIQIAGNGPTGVVKYSTFASVNIQDTCDLKGISAVMVPNIGNGGQTLARMSTSGIDKVINVGVVFDKAYPSGSTLIKGAKAAGLGDAKGMGDCYNCDGKTAGKGILVTPDIGQCTTPECKAWEVTLRKGIVVPVNWREISESDAD